MRNSILSLFILFVIAFGGCKNPSTINESEAGDVITSYLKGNPEYKTDRFHYGEMKFNSKKEMVELEKYKTLADEGYISMDLVQGKKKFLSRDSSFTYIIKLTGKASALVLKQGSWKVKK